jgi:hypothetical protein
LGLCFLCWPNLAYHLTRLFDDWPTTEGTVGSSEEQSTRRWIIRYDFGLTVSVMGALVKSKLSRDSRLRMLILTAHPSLFVLIL